MTQPQYPKGEGRRLGRFKVSGEFLSGLQRGEGANVLHGMAVLCVERYWHTNTAEYIAWHPDFEHVPHSEVIPEYEAIFDSVSATPRWRKIND